MYNSTSTLPFALPASAYAYRPFYHVERDVLFPRLGSDIILTVWFPVFTYWVVAAFFHLIDYLELPYFEKRRLHESAEVLSRNRVTLPQVIKAVAAQHVVQMILGFLALEDDVPVSALGHALNLERYSRYIGYTALTLFGSKLGQRVLIKYGSTLTQAAYWWVIPTLQFAWSFFVMDSWQYFLHRAFHVNKWLYRHVHSVHHRLYVPFACGALYNHPFEGFLFDTVGAIVAQLAAGLSTRQTLALWSISEAKTVDDHCGYNLPWDPFQALCGNNADYHDIHHQQYGIKKNFSQPWFVHWDVLLATRMTREQANGRRKHTDTKDPALKGSVNSQANGHDLPEMIKGYSNGHAKIE